MLIKDRDNRRVELMGKQGEQGDRIMGNSNNNSTHNKQLHMDNNTKDTNSKHLINKVMHSKVTQHMEIHMLNNNTVILMDNKLWELDNYLLPEKNKCLITVPLHNHNHMDQLGRKIRLKMLRHEKYLQVVQVVRQNKTYTIISKNLEQLKTTWYKGTQ